MSSSPTIMGQGGVGAADRFIGKAAEDRQVSLLVAKNTIE
jgi:hypothetical protein